MKPYRVEEIEAVLKRLAHIKDDDAFLAALAVEGVSESDLKSYTKAKKKTKDLARAVRR